MNNFTFYNPVKIVFGESVINKLPELLPSNKKVLMCYGSGSIKKNGLYNNLKTLLKNVDLYEFGGIMPNPEIEYLQKAVDICKQEKIDFILAVGGGSVIDASKFISVAAKSNSTSEDILKGKSTIEKAVPLGTVLTMPATGSEMNPAAVLSISRTKEKLVFVNENVFPKFSVIDTDIFKTLPKEQIANGIVDAFVHVCEQYVTYPANAKIQDAISEAVLRTLIEDGSKVFSGSYTSDNMKNFAWATTTALNGSIAAGTPQDWLIHLIGHEITALHGLAHARSLAVVLPSYYYMFSAQKREKLLAMAKNVWKIKINDENEATFETIKQIQKFFNSLNVSTNLADYNIDAEQLALEIKHRFETRKWLKLGEKANISPNDVFEIIRKSH